MLLLNFSHPLTDAHLEAIRALTGDDEVQVIAIPNQVDVQQPLAPQVTALADAAGLTPETWQTAALLVNLPALNFSAALLLAELHGRLGYFPAILRLRPVAGSTPPRFEVAEIINLQAVREQARGYRRERGGG
ncbi:CRISPR-associated protein Csx15 [Candidatus Amarolinea aalborgensis]|uniref:CRISPR-associated protein Csx15 n=1 Tax=Candidatus Amarolinea aalborgensis TaxID=2249329 RepID=UPI003BF9C15B